MLWDQWLVEIGLEGNVWTVYVLCSCLIHSNFPRWNLPNPLLLYTCYICETLNTLGSKASRAQAFFKYQFEVASSHEVYMVQTYSIGSPHSPHGQLRHTNCVRIVNFPSTTYSKSLSHTGACTICVGLGKTCACDYYYYWVACTLEVAACVECSILLSVLNCMRRLRAVCPEQRAQIVYCLPWSACNRTARNSTQNSVLALYVRIVISALKWVSHDCIVMRASHWRWQHAGMDAKHTRV